MIFTGLSAGLYRTAAGHLRPASNDATAPADDSSSEPAGGSAKDHQVLVLWNP